MGQLTKGDEQGVEGHGRGTHRRIQEGFGPFRLHQGLIRLAQQVIPPQTIAAGQKRPGAIAAILGPDRRHMEFRQTRLWERGGEGGYQLLGQPHPFQSRLLL